MHGSAKYSIFRSPHHPSPPGRLPTLIVTPSGQPSHLLYTYLHGVNENALLTPYQSGDLCVAKFTPDLTPLSSSNSSNGAHGRGGGEKVPGTICNGSRNRNWKISQTGIVSVIFKVYLPDPTTRRDVPVLQCSKPNRYSEEWSLFFFKDVGFGIPPSRVECGSVEMNYKGRGETRVSVTASNGDEEGTVWDTCGAGNADMVEWIALSLAFSVIDLTMSTGVPQPPPPFPPSTNSKPAPISAPNPNNRESYRPTETGRQHTAPPSSLPANVTERERERGKGSGTTGGGNNRPDLLRSATDVQTSSKPGGDKTNKLKSKRSSRFRWGGGGGDNGANPPLPEKEKTATGGKGIRSEQGHSQLRGNSVPPSAMRNVKSDEGHGGYPYGGDASGGYHHGGDYRHQQQQQHMPAASPRHSKVPNPSQQQYQQPSPFAVPPPNPRSSTMPPPRRPSSTGVPRATERQSQPPPPGSYYPNNPKPILPDDRRRSRKYSQPQLPPPLEKPPPLPNPYEDYGKNISPPVSNQYHSPPPPPARGQSNGFAVTTPPGLAGSGDWTQLPYQQQRNEHQSQNQHRSYQPQAQQQQLLRQNTTTLPLGAGPGRNVGGEQAFIDQYQVELEPRRVPKGPRTAEHNQLPPPSGYERKR